MKIATIVAHFDYRGIFDPTFVQQVEILHKVSTVTIVISCSQNANSADLPQGVIVIERPNFGYDFYSYKIGIEYLISNAINFDKLILTNSSYYIAEPEIFSIALNAAIEKSTERCVTGFVKSNQITQHLQSWLIVFDKRVIFNESIINFFQNIQIHTNKIDVIVNYELGLSSLLSASGFELASIYKSSFPIRLGDKNPMFVASNDVLRQCGVLKAEKLRRLDIGELTQLKIAPEILDSVNQNRRFYTQPTHSEKLEWLVYNRTKIQPRIAVVLHLYYSELASQIAIQLRNISVPFDIYITTSRSEVIGEILNAFGSVANKTSVCTVKNQGRDVLPFLKVIDDVNFIKNYDYLLKIHGKKSLYSTRGEQWRNNLYDALFGSNEIVERTLSLFENEKVGMIGPHYHFLKNERYWGCNKSNYYRIAKLLGLNQKFLTLGFFSGTMFWIRTALLRNFMGLHDKVIFEDEQGQRDGTMAHAIERLFVPMCHSEGYTATTLELNGEDVSKIDSDFNLFV